MTLIAFSCSECGHRVRGPNCAISLTIECLSCDRTVTAYPFDPDYSEELLKEIREGDQRSTNGGYYVELEQRDEAKELVIAGKVVRMTNPAGRSPQYVPMDSEHYNTERLERLRDQQSEV